MTHRKMKKKIKINFVFKTYRRVPESRKKKRKKVMKHEMTIVNTKTFVIIYVHNIYSLNNIFTEK